MKFLKMHTQIRKKKKLLWLLLLVPVLAIILIINQMANFFQPGTPGSTVNEEIIAKTAEKGSIQTVLSTAGSISDTDSASVHVAALIAIPTQSARYVREPQVRLPGEIGRRSGLISPFAITGEAEL